MPEDESCSTIPQRVAKPWELEGTAAYGQLTLIPNFSVGKNVEIKVKCQYADAQCFTRIHSWAPGCFSMGIAKSIQMLNAWVWGALLVDSSVSLGV